MMLAVLWVKTLLMFKCCMILVEHNRISKLLFYIKVNPKKTKKYHKNSINII